MVTLAAASWGTWSLFLRPAGLPATTSAPIIFLVMGLATLPIALRSPPVRWDRRARALLAAHALLDAANVLTFFAAMQHTTVAIAVLTHYLAPIIVALAAPLTESARTRGAVPAAVVALGGLVIVLEPWRAPAAAAGDAALGAALGAASAACYAGNVLVVSRLAARVGAGRSMSYHALLAAAALAPLAIPSLGEVGARQLGILATGAVAIGAGSGVLFAIGLLRIGPARAAILTFVEPLVAVAIGALVWQEELRPLAAVGGALVLGAGAWVARTPRPVAVAPAAPAAVD